MVRVLNWRWHYNLIKLVAAIDLNSSLGYKNKLLTKQKADQKQFKKLTLNNTIVLGRNTFESILRYRSGKPLADRKHIVLTSSKLLPQYDNVVYYDSVEDILNDFAHEDLYICGGEEVYRQFLPHADEIHLTIFHTVFPEFDTVFPSIKHQEWDCPSNVPHGKDEDNQFNYNFVVYKRKSSK